MKRLIIILLLFSPFLLKAQKISELPEDTVFQATDLLYSIDQGVTSKKMTGARIFLAMYQFSDSVRSELADTAASLRAAIGGGGMWEVDGDNIQPIDFSNKTIYGYDISASNSITATGEIITYTALGIGTTPSGYALNVTGALANFNNGYRSDLWRSKTTYGHSISYSPTTFKWTLTDISGSHLLEDLVSPFDLTGTTISPTNSSYGLSLGGSTLGNYIFRANGNVFMEDTLFMGDLLGGYRKIYAFSTYGIALGKPDSSLAIQSWGSGSSIKNFSDGFELAGLFLYPDSVELRSGNSSKAIWKNNLFNIDGRITATQRIYSDTITGNKQINIGGSKFNDAAGGFSISVEDAASGSIIYGEYSNSDRPFISSNYFWVNTQQNYATVTGYANPVEGFIFKPTDRDTIYAYLGAKWQALNGGGGSGTGNVQSYGTFNSDNIALVHNTDTITSNDNFKFTGSTKTAGSFYTGTSNPSNTNRLNYDGVFHASSLYAYDILYLGTTTSNIQRIGTSTIINGSTSINLLIGSNPRLIAYNDSTVINNKLYLDHYQDVTATGSDTIAGMIINRLTGMVDTSYLTPAGRFLTSKLKPFELDFFDREQVGKHKELRWPVEIPGTDSIDNSLRTITPLYGQGQVQGRIEMLMRYLFRTRILLFISILIITFLGYNQIRLNKRLRKLEK